MLQGMGLFVLPVFAEDDPERIDYMRVSVALPSAATKECSKNATGLPIAAPVSGSHVVGGVGAAKGGRMNVIDFPSVLGKLSVLAPTDHAAVAIESDVGLTESGNGF